MNTNKFFSFNRFYLLLRNDMLLNYKKYLLTIAGAFILGFIILYTNMPSYVTKGEFSYVFDSMRYTQLFVMSLIGLLAFVGSAFPNLGSKVKTSNYLLLPSSTFEKFLSQFVIYVLAGTLIFLIVFWVDAQLARYIALMNLKERNNELLGVDREKYIEMFKYSMLIVKSTQPVITYCKLFEGLGVLFVMFSVGMYFFSVKLFFQKLGFVKTAISLIVIGYLGVVFMTLISHLFYPDANSLFEISNEMNYKLKNGYLNFEIWMYLTAFAASLFIIPFGYFKLKEKEL